MKHIYIFNTDSQAGDYGIGTYLRELKVCLHSEPEITLTFVELQSVEKEFSVVEMAGVRYIKIPSPQTHPSWQFQAKRMKAYNLAVCCLLKKYVNAGEENVFHLNYLQHDSLVPYLREMIPLCKIICTIHYLNRISNNENKNAYYDEIGKKKHEWIDAAGGFVYDSYSRMKAMCQSVDKVICLSLHTFNLLQTECELSQNKLFFISNGLQDEALMLDEEQKRVFKDELSLTVNEKVVLFVGRLDAAKGLLLLIRAFKKVVAHIHDARLIIVGDGRYDELLKECSSFYGKVTFTGKVDKNFLYQLYQITDVGVHPSLNEQCSYVAIEMMMHGIPLIELDVIGVGKMIKSGYNGYKVSIDDKILPVFENTLLVEQLGNCIIKVLENGKLRRELGKNSREVYLNQYNEVRMKNKILEVYY